MNEFYLSNGSTLIVNIGLGDLPIAQAETLVQKVTKEMELAFPNTKIIMIPSKAATTYICIVHDQT